MEKLKKVILTDLKNPHPSKNRNRVHAMFIDREILVRITQGINDRNNSLARQQCMITMIVKVLDIQLRFTRK